MTRWQMAMWEALWEHVARSRLLEDGPMVSVLPRRRKEIVDYICGSDMWTPCFQYCYLVNQPDLHRLFLLYVTQIIFNYLPKLLKYRVLMSVKEKHNLASVFHSPCPFLRPSAHKIMNLVGAEVMRVILKEPHRNCFLNETEQKNLPRPLWLCC